MKALNSISSYFQREKNFNKKLVRTLNYKMFKGFRVTKEAKKLRVKKPKYIDDIYWESKTIDPFEDYYDIDYKKKNLSSLYNIDFSNMLQINSIFPDKNKALPAKKKLTHKLRVPSQKGESFRKRKIINLTKKPPYNNQYFYFCSNSQLIKNNAFDNSNERKKSLYNTIFQDKNEKELYNDIPFFAIDKLHKITNKSKKKYKYLKSKEERVNDLEFLYKVSHPKSKNKMDFRNRYNIRSAKINKYKMESKIIKNGPNNLKTKSVTMNSKLSLNQSSQNNKDFTIFNSSFKTINLNKEKKNFSCIYKKKIFNEIGIQSQDSKLHYNASTGNLIINKSNLINNEKITRNQTNYSSYIFPIKQRIISNQVYKDQLQFKRWRFDKLKKLMEL